MTKDKTVDELVDEMYKQYPFDMDNAVDTLLNRVVKKLQSQETTLNLYRGEVKANNKSMIAAGDKIKSQQKHIEELEFSNKQLTIQLEAELKQQQDSSND